MDNIKIFCLSDFISSSDIYYFSSSCFFYQLSTILQSCGLADCVASSYGGRNRKCSAEFASWLLSERMGLGSLEIQDTNNSSDEMKDATSSKSINARSHLNGDGDGFQIYDGEVSMGQINNTNNTNNNNYSNNNDDNDNLNENNCCILCYDDSNDSNNRILHNDNDNNDSKSCILYNYNLV